MWYLIGDDYRRSRQIAEDLAGMVGGILSLSAALPGRRTLATFPAGMARLSEVSTRVASAPPQSYRLMKSGTARPGLAPPPAGARHNGSCCTRCVRGVWAGACTWLG